MLTFTLTIVEIRKENDDTCTYCFKQPGLKKVKYLAGQYLTLIFKINGRRYLRPYSFSSAPGVDVTLNITVKRMLGGVVSNHIIDKLAVGDLVEVMPPMGDFTLPDDTQLNNKHLVLWGSGSGITPLMSIIKYTLSKALIDRVTLVYGNRSVESTIFNAELQALKQEHANTFKIINFYTQAVLDFSSPYLHQGRISPSIVLSMLHNAADMQHTLHYICGPAGLKESVKTTLLSTGIQETAIHSEDFEVTRNPEDLAGITTQAVIIKTGDKQTSVEVTKGNSILEAALDAMLEIDYSCQTGDCLLCKARLTEGKVKMIGAKKAQLLETNECLLCCSFPLTGNVAVTI